MSFGKNEEAQAGPWAELVIIVCAIIVILMLALL